MSTPIVTSKTVLTALTMIYFSLVMVVTAFGLVVLFLNYSGGISGNKDVEFAQLFRYVLFAVLPLGLMTGYFVFKRTIATISSTASLKEKLMKYQQALLFRSACFELPGLLGSVAALLTGDNSFLLFTALVVIMFFLVRPTVYSITTDLTLSSQERDNLENPAFPLT